MKIIDAFIFYNELELLYYRLSILYDIVDYFIIVEATLTHAGNPKILYYNENKELFSKFQDKIIHIIDDKLITKMNDRINDPWINENHQRNYIYEGIKQLVLEPNDKIMVSDVDEIPDPHVLKKMKENNTKFEIMHFEQDFYYYNLTCKHVNKWPLSKIVSYDAYINRFNKQAQIFRHYDTEGAISPGGWHLSYFGDSKFIRNKIEQFAHQELNNEFYKNEENIKRNINNCNDVYMRPDIGILKIPILENKYLPPQYEIYLKNYLG